jgi:hypothetical protein
MGWKGRGISGTDSLLSCQGWTNSIHGLEGKGQFFCQGGKGMKALLIQKVGRNEQSYQWIGRNQAAALESSA